MSEMALCSWLCLLLSGSGTQLERGLVFRELCARPSEGKEGETCGKAMRSGEGAFDVCALPDFSTEPATSSLCQGYTLRGKRL